TYKEEKEQSVFLILDVSASQSIGTAGQQKIDIGKEICGVLALVAAKQSSHIGMVCVSDQKEKYIKPNIGIEHAYTIIKSIFELKPKSLRTNLAAGIKLALSIIKRRSIIILISDFIDQNYERELTMLAKKHDLVVIQLVDKREVDFPALGIIPLLDKETGKTIWVNTSSASFQHSYLSTYADNQEKIAKISRKYQANYLTIDTSAEYVPQLINLFRIRNLMRKSA
ncbi:MAG: VWA domain-containing protein, partial [Bacteroidota bacterium]|nr:VWA domain-containing protein [Bacteroidota bacterium]